MRILVIEDERKIASFIKRGLKEDGYTVDTAFDGEEGYRLTADSFSVCMITNFSSPVNPFHFVKM